MKNVQRLTVLRSSVIKSNMPCKELYIEALDEGIRSIKVANRKEIIAALIVGTGLAVGLALVGYLTYIIK